MQGKTAKSFISFSLLTIITVIIFLCIPDLSRAQSSITDPLMDTQRSWVQVLNNIIGIASWIWIVPAKIAGLLMSNSFVYGTSFYLVDYLFMFWQIIRTFALYGLGLYFVGYIIYARFHTEEAKSKLATLFKNTLIAGLLISMSWRLVAAAVDLSIIFTSAVASIPSQIYEEGRTKKQQCFSTPKEIVIQEDYLPDTDLMGNPNNYRSPGRDSIKPQGDDIGPPIMFIGSAVLKFFDMVYIPEQDIQGTDNNAQRELSKTLIVVVVKAIMLLLLLIPMVVLMVVNMIRVVCLRIRIIFSPGIVLINIFGMKVSDQLDKYLSRQNILGLIMQPVAVIGMLSIGFIFIIELASIFNMCIQQQPYAPIAVTAISEGIDAPIGEMMSPIGTETTLGASLSAVGEVVGGVTGQLIVAIFVIILFRTLIKIGFSFSELTKETAKSITDSMETMASTVPLIPLPGVGAVGLGTAQNFAKGGFGIDKRIGNKLSAQEDTLREHLGFNKGQIKRTALRNLHEKAGRTDTALTSIQTAIKDETKKSYILAHDAQSILKDWLKSSGTYQENIKLIDKLGLTTLANGLRGGLITDEELEKLRNKDSKYVNDAYKLLNRLFGTGGAVATNRSNNIAKYGPYDE